MPYRVIQWATGGVGALCLKAIIEHPDLELAGVLVYNPDKDGQDAGTLVGLDPVGVTATRDRDAIMRLDADCVIHAPLAANPAELDADVIALLRAGKNVVSTAGYYAPEARGPEIKERLEEACRAGGATLYGTGIDPGFVFDRVVPTLTGMCTDIESMELSEIADATPVPAASLVMDAMGMGQPVESITADGPFQSYFLGFFAEETQAVANAMGLNLERIDRGVEALPATRDIHIAAGVVKAGTVGALRYWFQGIVEGKAFLNINIVWMVERGLGGWPEPAKQYTWVIDIEGRPSAHVVLDLLPSFDPTREEYDVGFYATMATAVHAVPAICAAPPGLFHVPVFAPWRPRRSG